MVGATSPAAEPAPTGAVDLPVPHPADDGTGRSGRRWRRERHGPRDLADLVDAARLGDVGALDELVRVTYPGAYAIAFRLTGNEDDARDVVQEAYLRAQRGLTRFRGDAQFTTWLYRITANCASSLLAKRRRTATEPLADDAPLPDLREDRDPEWRATSAEERETVAAALAELPPRLRQVIVLRDIYDLSHQAIAANLGISEAAAKVRLHRARRRLKEHLDRGPTTDGDGEAEPARGSRGGVR